MFYATKIRRLCIFAICATVGLIATSGSASASTILINGATCLPTNEESRLQMNIVHQSLYANGGVATCHFDLHRPDMDLRKLVSVAVVGEATGKGSVKLNLCTYGYGKFLANCGKDEVLSDRPFPVFVNPPELKPNNLGMFVLISFRDLRDSDAARIYHLEAIFSGL